MKLSLAAALLTLSPSLVLAQGTPSTHSPSHAIVAQPSAIQWQAGPPSLPPGARAVVLEGDPAQPGPFTMRLLLPDGYRIPPHFHGGQERLTVISGTFVLGMGNRFDEAEATPLTAGAYASMAPGTAHFARARGETVVQLNNVGPWSVTYVDAADDPRTRPGR